MCCSRRRSALLAVGRLVQERLGVAPDPPFTAACHRATGGSPFLVRELIEALSAQGMSPDARMATRVETVGARTARRWIQLRLGRLPAPAARLARAVAVLSAPSCRARPLSPSSTSPRPRKPRTRWSRQGSFSRSAR